MAFFIGGIIGVIGIILRTRLHEESSQENVDSPREEDEEEVFNLISHNEKASSLSSSSGKTYPIFIVFHDYWRELILVTFTTSLWSCCYYSCFVWMAYYMAREDLIGGNGIKHSWLINFVMNIMLILFFPISGCLGDYLGEVFADKNEGNRKIMQFSAIFIAIISIPAFYMIATRVTLLAVIGQFLFVIGLSLFGGNLPAFMLRKFEYSLRCSGIGSAYNLANALFAGTAPLIQTSLVLVGKDSSVPLPGVYICAISLFTFLTLTFYAPYCDSVRERNKATSKEFTADINSPSHNLILKI